MNKDDALGKAKGKQKALLQTDRNSISLRCGRGALLHHNAPSQRPRIRHGIGLGLDRALGYHQHAGACAAINRVLRCLWHQYATHNPSLFVVQWAPVRRGPVKGAGGCRGCMERFAPHAPLPSAPRVRKTRFPALALGRTHSYCRVLTRLPCGWQFKSKTSQLAAQAPEFTPTKGSPKTIRTPSKNALDCTEEVNQAAHWWSSKMRQHDLAFSEVSAFEAAVRNGLMSKCSGHWYPNDPLRGSGHRSLVNDISTDPVFLAAAAEVRIRDVGGRLPRGVMWVNPGSVKVQLEMGRYPETIYSNCNSGTTSEGTASDDDDL